MRLKAITKRFGPTTALEDVDFSINPGEIHALIGENGAGKSTLMKVLAGVVTPDSGTIELDGKVAMIHQELSLSPHLSVEDCFALVGITRRTAREALKDYAEIHPGSRVDSLSISAQQQVEIARAIALGSKTLVLDEPTSSLSTTDAAKLFQMLRALKARNHAIVYVSHFLEEVREISDRVTVLRDGRVVGSYLTKDLSSERMVELMMGRKLAELYPKSKHENGGEVLGIAGLVGSGRSRYLRSLFGDPTSAWSRGIGLVSENRKEEGLALSLSVAQNLILSRPVRKSRTVAQKWVDRLSIRCRDVDQRAGELSGGNQQKIAIARLLHHGVNVVLLDEPTRGIDVGSKAEIYRLIDALALEGKKVVVVSSHMPELLGICDRIAVMRRGHLGEPKPVSEWTEHRLTVEASQ